MLGSYLTVLGAAEGATSNTVSTVTKALTDGLEGAGSDMLGVISSVVPVVIPVMIGVAVIGIGIKVFKKVTGKN